MARKILFLFLALASLSWSQEAVDSTSSSTTFIDADSSSAIATVELSSSVTTSSSVDIESSITTTTSSDPESSVTTTISDPDSSATTTTSVESGSASTTSSVDSDSPSTTTTSAGPTSSTDSNFPEQLNRTADQISTSCKNLHVKHGWLSGNCTAGSESNITRSAIWLPAYIGNGGGNLTWATKGGFINSCDCEDIVDNEVLQCECVIAGQDSEKKKATTNTTLKLSEHINNYQGYLLSDFKTTPSIPQSPAQIPVPDPVYLDIGAGWGGACNYSHYWSTIYLDEGVTRMPYPGECFELAEVEYDGGDLYAITQLRVVGPTNAWEIAVFDNKKCDGKMIGTAQSTPLDRATQTEGKNFVCVPIPDNKKAKAIKLKPNFNAEYG